jgi:uncharacterized ubiquitin-like protein YukD
MELDLGATHLATQKAWKLRNNKARFDIVLNLGDAQIEPIKPHKIAKVLWDALKLMYEPLDKATIVVLNKFFFQT